MERILRDLSVGPMLKSIVNGRFLRIAVRTVPALLVAVALVVPLQTPEAQALPTGLPTHFAVGIGASPGDTWMPSTGVPWDFRFQYLSGGVNTNQGWETWNTNGGFASGYATESASHGYIPMFPYYELFQSNSTCSSCDENQKDITNLNTPSLMNAYYANFALLMQRLGPGSGNFGKTALVNVEPDFAGGYAVQAVNNNSGACFGFCTGQGNDPALLKASVANSGYADVASYPNTYLGFTQALAHLRDKYAPNVLLGYDISPWATGDDIGLDTSTNVNATGLGQQVGTFLSKVGPHEVLFNDPSDRDAGQYKYVYGQSSRFWDRLNVKFPNFARWEQYLHGAISVDGNKPMYLWQVPLGNQYFDTENNTNGHYQDNRAEYIFGHVQELVNNGIAGAMFMAGNGGNTTYNDADGDGTTNPASFCTTDGLSSGQICNNHTSTVSDDDGGYVRMSAKTYFQAPVALSGGSSPTSTPTRVGTSTPTPASTATSTPTARATNTPTARPTNTPTTRPTNTPTSRPSTPTATATSGSTQRSFTSSASTSPSTVTRPGTAAITTSVKSATATSTLIDVEVYNAAGSRVFQQVWDNQSFTAGQTRTFTASYAVPSNAGTGTYTVMVGEFSPGWGTVYAWNGGAGTFSVR
jgi:hypothetical protein